MGRKRIIRTRMLALYDDGGRKKQLGLGSAGDCVVRALAIVLNPLRSYKEVFDDLSILMDKKPDKGVRGYQIRQYLKALNNQLGVTWEAIPVPLTPKYYSRLRVCQEDIPQLRTYRACIESLPQTRG